MASWSEVEAQAPELSARARELFDAYKHKTMATLRRDGSPRISGTETEFKDGELYIGSMLRAVKALDLQRDPRFALHANPGDGSMEGGDAKVAGRAVEVTDEAELDAFRAEVETPPGPMHLFRLLLSEVVLTSLHPDGDRLVIETWRPGAGVRRVERY
jgi:pyridoxamine 5'-phosphate oxidase-like protein